MTFDDTTNPRARIEHTCDQCTRTISVGETYTRWVGTGGDGVQTMKTCQQCNAYQRALIRAYPDCPKAPHLAVDCPADWMDEHNPARSLPTTDARRQAHRDHVKEEGLLSAAKNLAAVVAAYADTPADRRVITATSSANATSGETTWTGLTMGDLRALHRYVQHEGSGSYWVVQHPTRSLDQAEAIHDGHVDEEGA